MSGGQPSARGSNYSYTYETVIDEPQPSTIHYGTTTEFSPINDSTKIKNNEQNFTDEIYNNELERFSKSTQKVCCLFLIN